MNDRAFFTTMLRLMGVYWALNGASLAFFVQQELVAAEGPTRWLPPIGMVFLGACTFVAAGPLGRRFTRAEDPSGFDPLRTRAKDLMFVGRRILALYLVVQTVPHLAALIENLFTDRSPPFGSPFIALAGIAMAAALWFVPLEGRRKPAADVFD